MNELKEFMTEQYRAELSAFRTALEAVPEADFAQPRLGSHSAAWHALHVAEWLRLAVLGDRSASYGFLGWEDAAWLPPLLGTAPANEQDSQRVILGELDGVGGQLVSLLKVLPDSELDGPVYSPATPGGQRPLLAALGLHLRHIAYHRGQVRLSQREQA